MFKTLQVLLGGGLLVLLVASTTSGAQIRAWHVIVLVVLAYFSGAVATEFFRNRNQTALMAALLETEQPVTYKLDDWGVYAISGQTTTSTPWAGVRRVLVADGFVLFARGDGVAFVPRTAFQSDRQMDEFATFAASRLRRDA